MARKKTTYSLYLHAKSGYQGNKVYADGTTGCSRWHMQSNTLEPLIRMIDKHCNPQKKRMPWEHVQVLKYVPGKDIETIFFIRPHSIYDRREY